MLAREYFKLLIEAIFEENEKYRNLRVEAIRKLYSIVYSYQEDMYQDKLLLPILRKKGEMILQSTTKAEAEKILKPSVPKYNGGEFVPQYKGHIEEEELILWSKASLKGPLISAAAKRCMELFAKIYPEESRLR
jgi:hypothetical protein